MKVLVTGGTGLLGYWIVKELAGHGYLVYATHHTKKPPRGLSASWLRLDLTNTGSVVGVVREANPDVIIHAAAYTDVDDCELRKDHAYRVNVLGTRALTHVASELGIKVVYVSTDYVFDGERGMYGESDVPNPVNFYGLTKLLGEESTLTSSPRNAVVRVSGLYGCSPTGKRNFGIKALEALASGKEVRAFTDQFLSPTYVPELAKSVVKLLEVNYCGLIHVAGERMTRYEFALKLARVGGFDTSLVRPASIKEVRLAARRPRDSSLSTVRAKALNLAIPDTESCLKEFVRKCLR